MKLFNLEGNVAVVTGADVACFDRPGSLDMNGTVHRIAQFGRKAHAIEGDVTVEADLKRMVEETEKHLGELTLAVNAAGIANAEAAENMPREQWQKMIDVDYTGVFLSCQAEARVMLPRKKGAIVNIASMSGIIVNRGLMQCHYNSAKAAVIHLSKSLAMEWADKGLRVNSISPGYTFSPMNKRPEVAEQVVQFAADTPMGRLAEVEEMVGPAIFLLSNAASFCTGHDLVVDGGFVCW